MNIRYSALLLGASLAMALSACSSGSRPPGAASSANPAATGAPSGTGGTTAPSTSAGTPAPSPTAPSAPPVGGASGSTIQTFATGLSPRVELHVATSGDDTAGDGSAQNPFATIQRAAQQVAPGTAIRVHPGTYGGGISLSGLSGAPSAPIWIGGVPGGAKPVIQGGNTGLQLSEVRYLVLHDLVVQGASLNGINCDDGGRTSDPEATRYVSLERLEITDVGSGGNHDGLKLSGLDDYFVLDCLIARVSAGSGIDHVGCHDGLIARCRLEDTGSNAIQLKGGTRNVEVRWCTLLRPGQRGLNIGGSTGDPYFRPPLSAGTPNVEASEIRVLGNVIVGGETAFAFVGATDCVVSNTTVVDPATWLFRVLQERTTGGGFTFTETRDCTVQNTIFYYSSASLRTHVNVGANTQPGTYTFNNNLYHAHDAGAQTAPNLPAAEQGTVLSDPAFTDAASGDYTLTPTSAARGAGVAQTLLSTDASGASFAATPSVGAYAAP
jgi:hypothetical protein